MNDRKRPFGSFDFADFLFELRFGRFCGSNLSIKKLNYTFGPFRSFFFRKSEIELHFCQKPSFVCRFFIFELGRGSVAASASWREANRPTALPRGDAVARQSRRKPNRPMALPRGDVVARQSRREANRPTALPRGDVVARQSRRKPSGRFPCRIASVRQSPFTMKKAIRPMLRPSEELGIHARVKTNDASGTGRTQSLEKA
ncbi:MAG: hypothetical protein SPI19_03785 [Peptoniphilaceae bacterium]|nr:hypothetical protein [Peptoniphilaceae bacterium]